MTSASATVSCTGEYRIVRLDRCAVFVVWAQPAIVNEQHALEILQDCFELTQHRQYVVLVDLTMVREVSPEARRIFCSARNILVAGMLGNGPMDRVLAAPYEDAIYPSEYFTDESEALLWLRLLHDSLCRDPVEHTLTLTIDLDPFRSRSRRTESPRPT